MKKINFPQFSLMVAAFLTTLFFLIGCKKDPVVPDATTPTVITTAVSGITPSSAISGGIISSKGTSDVTAKGVCWRISSKPDISGLHTSDGTGTAEYTSNLANLSPNTTYYVRAYATNASGTGYGTAITFTTPQFTCEVPITYEGKTYETVLINSQCWFKENLNVGSRINGNVNQTNNGILEKHCYNDVEANCNFYGALYQWEEMMQYVTTPGAQGICHPGWHIPTELDWTILTDYLGGENVAGGKMKEAGLNNWASPNTGATNSSGFTAFGAGRHKTEGFDGIMLISTFWSSTPDSATATYAWSHTLDSSGGDIYNGPGQKDNSVSVRCIHD